MRLGLISCELLVGGGQHVQQVGVPDPDRRRGDHAQQQVRRGGGQTRRQRPQPGRAQPGRPEIIQPLGQRLARHVKAGPPRGTRRTRGAGRAAGIRGLLSAASTADLAQRREQFVPAPAAPGQQAERVAVELLGQHVADRGKVLARHLPVRAAAVHVQVAGGAREQRRAAVREHLLDLVRHLAGQQLGPEQRLAGQPVKYPPPLRGGQRQHPDADVVGTNPRPLYLGGDLALSELEVQHLPGPRVIAPPGQPAAHPVGLEHVDQPARPPLLPDRPPLANRLDAALHPDRPGRRPVLPAPAHSDTASGDNDSTERRSATDSSVSQASPVPTIWSARAFFSSIIASIRSSTVPTQTNLRTWTLRCCPIRTARAVACSSTAGFHHRSTWITWLAAVRLSPVPPALSDSRNSAGSSSEANSSTIASRCFFVVPPCRNSTGQPSLAARCGRSIRPNSAYCVKHSALSRAAMISSQISSSRASLPDLPGSREPSASSCAGWLHTCLSLVIVASTRPRRSMPSPAASAASILAIMSLTVAWYSDACSGVRLHQTFISCLSGRSKMIVLSVC